jgi:TonB family protein
MAAGTQAWGWNGPSRRRVPRYRVQAPLDVTVLRSGIPDTLPGRSLNLCERGLAAVLAGDLLTGEAVGLEVRLPLAHESLRTRALVRHHDKLRYGLEFVGLSAEQQAAIRDWAAQSKAEPELSTRPAPATQPRKSEAGGMEDTRPKQPGGPPHKRGQGLILLLVVAAVLLAVFWWRWNKGWEEIESGLPSHEAAVDRPQVQVPAEVMEKFLLHRVDPDYPPEARRAKLQGVIVLDVVVNQEGSVVDMHPRNGPEILSRAAMDALRWWKFEPYRVDGRPVMVQTTVAVEFKP